MSMLKARRKEQTEQPKFPEPRDGLPEDPHPFMGSGHFAAAAAVQEHLSARCLVAVVGPIGSGKSTVCRRAANSRWARHWFLQDEIGQPVHRRFWVDLEDAGAGADSEQRIARALARPTFAEALARLGNGRPCLLILDNADRALGEADLGDTLTQLVACVERGASIVVTRRSLAGLTLGRPWTDVVDVPVFATVDEGRHLFDHLAPQHAADWRVAGIVAACDRLPSAVNLMARAVAGRDLGAAGAPTGSEIESQRGLPLAMNVAAAVLEAPDRRLWEGLSLFPSGLTGDDIAEVFSMVGDARPRAIRLFDLRLAHRCEAGVRVPASLRRSGPDGDLTDVERRDLWHNYARRAQAVLGHVPAGTAGSAGPGLSTLPTAPRPTAGRPGAGADGGTGRYRPATEAADAWLVRQVATLSSLAALASLPEGAFEVACTGLLIHQSGMASDHVDAILLRVVERSLAGAGQLARPEMMAQAAQVAAALVDRRRFGPSISVATALTEAHRGAGNTRGQADALCQLGRAERFLARYTDAEAHLEEARRHFAILEDQVGQGSALFELGQVDLDLGRLDDAEAHLGQALSLFEANGRPVGAANANIDLVRVDLARGRLDLAEGRLTEALDRYESAGDKLGFANACLQLGQVELARGRLDSAERRFGGALNGYEQAADKVGFANACLQLGQVELARGRLDGAERRFRGALTGYDQVGDKVGVANAALQLGQIDLARGRLDTAGPRLRQALAAYQELGDRIGVANASLQLGQVTMGTDELDEADRLLGDAQAAYDEIGDQMGSANSRHVGAMLRQAQGRRSQATALFAEAAHLYSDMGRAASAGWSLAGAARACTGKAERIGYAADAVRLLEEAGLTDAAGQLAVQLVEPEPKPEPTSGAEKAEEAGAFEPWPAVRPPPSAEPTAPAAPPAAAAAAAGPDGDGPRAAEEPVAEGQAPVEAPVQEDQPQDEIDWFIPWPDDAVTPPEPISPWAHPPPVAAGGGRQLAAPDLDGPPLSIGTDEPAMVSAAPDEWDASRASPRVDEPTNVADASADAGAPPPTSGDGSEDRPTAQHQTLSPDPPRKGRFSWGRRATR
jgi:tetratricopeptide (TPR) repeat protein